MGKKMRVDKLLSNVGVASRAELKKYCKQGLISVNGKVINNPGVQVDSENDEVMFNGEKSQADTYQLHSINMTQ